MFKKKFALYSLIACTLSMPFSYAFSPMSNLHAATSTESNNEYSIEDLLINSSSKNIFMYKDDSLNGDVVAMICEGGTAFVLEEYSTCYYATSGNYKGYIDKKAVIRGEKAFSTEEKYCRKQATIEKDTVFLYQDEACSKAILSVYSKDTILDVSDSNNNSVHVMDSTGLEGYVSINDVTIEYIYTFATEPDIDLYCELYPDRALATYNDNDDYDSIQDPVIIDDSTYIYDAQDLSLGQQICDYAMQFVGNPYVWGGTSLTDGCDCSGMIMSVYKNFGIDLPRTSYQMRDYGYRVCEGLDLSLMQPGDVICYDGHVSLYIGNEQIISAANEELGIILTSVHNRTDYISVQRFVSGSQTRTIPLTDEDKEILYRIVEAEATGQCFLGKVYVANVILNRLLDPNYPAETIEEVVFAPGQFQPVTNGRYESVKISDETIYAVDYAVSHADNSQGALYFMNPETADKCNVEWFNTSLDKLFTFKDHAFYR